MVHIVQKTKAAAPGDCEEKNRKGLEVLCSCKIISQVAMAAMTNVASRSFLIPRIRQSQPRRTSVCFQV